jgi:hypothetical protein
MVIATLQMYISPQNLQGMTKDVGLTLGVDDTRPQFTCSVEPGYATPILCAGGIGLKTA